MAKIKDTAKAKYEDVKQKHIEHKAARAEKKKAGRTTNEILADLERKLALELEGMETGTKQFDAKQEELEKFRATRLNGRVSADNIAATVTSLTGVGGAIAYDSRHNFPKLAVPFIGKPPAMGKTKTK